MRGAASKTKLHAKLVTDLALCIYWYCDVLYLASLEPCPDLLLAAAVAAAALASGSCRGCLWRGDDAAEEGAEDASGNVLQQ